ncbi:MAG: DUF6456 domain-containing protein [Allorhizobium sp.]
MTEAGIRVAERRALVKLLRFALRGPFNVGEAAGEGAVRLVGPAGGLQVASACLTRAETLGLLVRTAGGMAAADEARAFLRRALCAGAEDGFQQQHRDTVAATITDDGGKTIKVQRNLCESPLAALLRLKEKSGAAYFSSEAIEAGERLCADFNRAGLQPRITASWEPRLSTRARGQAGNSGDIADSAAAARNRVNAAVEAIGPELGGAALDVCCFAKGLETVERERQWPARSAKLMLRAALLALARHYWPPVALARPRPRHWGDHNYRPTLP